MSSPDQNNFSTTLETTPRDGEGPQPLPLPVLTVLGHFDLSRVGDRVFLGRLLAGREVSLSRHQPRFAAPTASGTGRPLDDPFLSRTPLRIEPLADGGLRIRRDGCRTSLTVDGVAVEDQHTLTPATLDAGAVLMLAERLVLLLHRQLPSSAESQERFGLVGDSEGLARVRRAIEQVARLDVSVLLTGETGTGKELVARALHTASGRRGGAFVGVNLGALPTTLAAAELFGARRGAYTGAVKDHSGYFGQADGGTLFLDEIGEAPPEIQVMLLRVLETGERIVVGDQKPLPTNVRVVAATDADLDRRIVDGEFKAPLLHRLSDYPIHLPPLRARRDDVGRLLVYFLRRERERLSDTAQLPAPDASRPWVPAALVDRLARYHWPGNVRELRNVVRQLLIASRGRPVLKPGPELEALLSSVTSSPRSEPALAAAPLRRRKPSEIPEEELVAALRASRWELKAAARVLGIARTSLHSLVERSPRLRSAVTPEEIRRAFERHGGEIEAMVEDLELSERALRRRLKDMGLPAS